MGNPATVSWHMLSCSQCICSQSLMCQVLGQVALEADKPVFNYKGLWSSLTQYDAGILDLRGTMVVGYSVHTCQGCVCLLSEVAFEKKKTVSPKRCFSCMASTHGRPASTLRERKIINRLQALGSSLPLPDPPSPRAQQLFRVTNESGRPTSFSCMCLDQVLSAVRHRPWYLVWRWDIDAGWKSHLLTLSDAALILRSDTLDTWGGRGDAHRPGKLCLAKAK